MRLVLCWYCCCFVTIFLPYLYWSVTPGWSGERGCERREEEGVKPLSERLTALASHTRKAPARVHIIADQIGVSVGTLALASKAAYARSTRSDLIHPAWWLVIWRAVHLPKGPNPLPLVAHALPPSYASDRSAYVALVADIVPPAVRASAHAAPHSNRRAHFPVPRIIHAIDGRRGR